MGGELTKEQFRSLLYEKWKGLTTNFYPLNREGRYVKAKDKRK